MTTKFNDYDNQIPTTELYVICNWRKALSVPLELEQAEIAMLMLKEQNPEYDNLRLVPYTEYRSWCI